MENIFEWRKEYLVGNEDINNQHKKLFKLGRMIDSSSNVEDAIILINELGVYAQEHFSLEEDHMKSMGYPAVEEHIVLHEKLVEDLNAFGEKGINTSDDVDQIKNFFFYWLLDHVMMQDMKYFYYSKNKK